MSAFLKSFNATAKFVVFVYIKMPCTHAVKLPVNNQKPNIFGTPSNDSVTLSGVEEADVSACSITVESSLPTGSTTNGTAQQFSGKKTEYIDHLA